MHRRTLRQCVSLCSLWTSSLPPQPLGREAVVAEHRLRFLLRPATKFSTLAVADEKLEPVGHTKVEEAEKHASQETSHLVYNLPAEWYSQKMSPVLKRDRMVLRISDWAKRRSMTPALLVRIVQGPLSPLELKKYTSNQIARIVFAVGLMKKTHRLMAEPDKIYNLTENLISEATERKRLITYDGMGLSQAAFGFSMMQLEDTSVFKTFAEEAVKPHRIRNSLGKSVVNLLDSFHAGNYRNPEHVRILSQAAVSSLQSLPTFALPKLLNAWGHFEYDNDVHVRATLAEIIKENRLNGLLASHIEEILTACAKLKFRESKIVTLFVRELIYSQKWKFMHHASLPRIVWSLGELRHEQSSHWNQILTATLDPDRVCMLESNLLVDVFVGWSKVAFRDSALLEALGKEATKERHVTEYSTRQLFEIFKAQRALGQMEKAYAKPIIDRLKDTDKLMKCNVETKIKLFLYPNIKKILGMKNVASLAKEIFQPMCLERWDTSVLMHLVQGLVALGPQFGVCFGVLLKELHKEDRLGGLTTDHLHQLFSAWGNLEVEDETFQSFAAECSKPKRLKRYSEEELLKMIWILSHLDEKNLPELVKPLCKEAMKRSVSVFTGKGLTMILLSISKTNCLDKEEISSIVEAIMTDEKLGELTISQLESLTDVLTNLGFEQESLTACQQLKKETEEDTQNSV